MHLASEIAFAQRRASDDRADQRSRRRSRRYPGADPDPPERPGQGGAGACRRTQPDAERRRAVPNCARAPGADRRGADAERAATAGRDAVPVGAGRPRGSWLRPRSPRESRGRRGWTGGHHEPAGQQADGAAHRVGGAIVLAVVRRPRRAARRPTRARGDCTRAWRRRIRDLTPETPTWTPSTHLGGLAGSILGVGDDVALRRGLVLYRQVVSQQESAEQRAGSRSAAGAGGERAGRPAASSRPGLASQARTLLGILAFGAARQRRRRSQPD